MHSPAPFANPDLLIVGCGYLGQRIVRQWCGVGRIFALTRNRPDELRALGAIPIVGDVLDAASLERLPPVGAVVYAVGLDRTTGHSMHDVYVHGLTNVLEALTGAPRIAYVSSTSVYAQQGGEWVDETAATEPVDESGRIVLKAEATLRAKRPDAIILRSAGIYGPGRLLRRATALHSAEPIAADPDRWLNLIHVEDAANAVRTALERGPNGTTYNVADDRPPTRREFYSELARLLGAPMPVFVPGADKTNRRIVNRKMKNELGVSLRYPSFVEGLQGTLNAHASN